MAGARRPCTVLASWRLSRKIPTTMVRTAPITISLCHLTLPRRQHMNRLRTSTMDSKAEKPTDTTTTDNKAVSRWLPYNNLKMRTNPRLAEMRFMHHQLARHPASSDEPVRKSMVWVILLHLVWWGLPETDAWDLQRCRKRTKGTAGTQCSRHLAKSLSVLVGYI